jgi:hypothetical protein
MTRQYDESGKTALVHIPSLLVTGPGPFQGQKPEAEETVSWRPEVGEVAPPPISKELKKRWSYFIRKVYETDPLTCPKCRGEMRIISVIDQPDVIKKILQHLKPSLLQTGVNVQPYPEIEFRLT